MADEGSALKAFRAGVFGRAAATYDQVGDHGFTRLGRRLVELAAPAAGEAVLDVACGRGAVLVPAAEAVGPGGRAVGIDLAPEMVELATRELRARGLGNAEARSGDGEDLSGFEAGEFDLVTCGFSIFFFPAPETALAEFRRVLRPGGAVAISSWGKNDPAFAWYGGLLKEFGVRVRMMSRPFDEPDQLAEALDGAGFEDVRIEVEDDLLRVEGAEEWWRWLLSAGCRAHVEALSLEDRERFREAAFERFEAHADHGRFEHRATALYAIGRKPAG